MDPYDLGATISWSAGAYFDGFGCLECCNLERAGSQSCSGTTSSAHLRWDLTGINHLFSFWHDTSAVQVMMTKKGGGVTGEFTTLLATEMWKMPIYPPFIPNVYPQDTSSWPPSSTYLHLDFYLSTDKYKRLSMASSNLIHQPYLFHFNFNLTIFETTDTETTRVNTNIKFTVTSQFVCQYHFAFL